MAYAVDEKMPETLFVQLLTEKANMLKKHLKDTHSSLVICVNIGPNMDTFKLYNTKEEDSLKQHVTISNLGDIGKTIELYQLWIQLKLFVKGILSPLFNCINIYIKNIYKINIIAMIYIL